MCSISDRLSTMVATASHDGTIRIWKIPGGTLITEIPLPDGITTLKRLHFNKSSTHLKATSIWGSLYVWDLRTSPATAQIPRNTIPSESNIPLSVLRGINTFPFEIVTPHNIAQTRENANYGIWIPTELSSLLTHKLALETPLINRATGS